MSLFFDRSTNSAESNAVARKHFDDIAELHNARELEAQETRAVELQVQLSKTKVRLPSPIALLKPVGIRELL